MVSLVNMFSEEAIRRMAGNLGAVSDVKMDAKSFSAVKIGRAKVSMNLLASRQIF